MGFRCLALTLVLVASPTALSQPVTLNFDTIGSLADYAPLGVTFSPNIVRWGPFGCSVLADPSCGPYSVPFGICAGNCGGQGPGFIFFNPPVRRCSIVALSGPGPDNLTAGVLIRAYDAANVVLDVDTASTTTQFQRLDVAAATDRIARLELLSLVLINEAWDELVITRCACLADTDDGSGTGTCDGGVTIDDLLYYLRIFEEGDIRSDVDDGSNTGTPDGGVTIDDLLYYLQRFEAGC